MRKNADSIISLRIGYFHAEYSIMCDSLIPFSQTDHVTNSLDLLKKYE